MREAIWLAITTIFFCPDLFFINKKVSEFLITNYMTTGITKHTKNPLNNIRISITLHGNWYVSKHRLHKY
jgi:hypothetical protein